MKKIQYIAPAMQVTQLYLRDGILQNGSDINGNGGNSFGDSRDGEDGDEADVKRRFNVWNEDWN